MDAIIHDWKFYFPVEEKTGILLNEKSIRTVEKRTERWQMFKILPYNTNYKINIRKIQRRNYD